MINFLGDEYIPQPLSMAWEGIHLTLFREGKYAGTVAANGWTGKMMWGDYTKGEPILTNYRGMISLAEMALIIRTWEAGPPPPIAP